MESEITTIRVAYSEFPPFVEIGQENGEEIIEGFMPEIVRSLAQWMNLKVEWIREPEDRFGTWENNTWNGMCGMLFRNEVDFIVNPLLPSDDYAEVAFYTNPVMYEAFTILSGKQKMDGGFFLYFSVLRPLVWSIIGVSLIVIALISAALFLRISGTSNNWITAISEYLWVYIAYMLRQAPNEKWVFLSSRKYSLLIPLMPLLITLWSLGVSFLIMTVFQSLLVSKLTIVRSQPTVDSMQEFLEKKSVIGIAPIEIELHEVLKTSRSTWSLLVSKLTIVRSQPAVDSMQEFLEKKSVIGIAPIQIELQEVLKGSGIPVYEDTWTRLEPELVDIESVFDEESFAALEAGRLCIFHGKLILRSVLSDYYYEHGRCNFHISDNVFFPFPLLMALQRTLPEEFLNKFNYGSLTRLVDADLSGKWFKPIDRRSQLCTSYSENTLKPLNLQNILGVLVIWAGGIFLSFIAFIVEKFSYTEQKKPSPPKRTTN